MAETVSLDSGPWVNDNCVDSAVSVLNSMDPGPFTTDAWVFEDSSLVIVTAEVLSLNPLLSTSVVGVCSGAVETSDVSPSSVLVVASCELDSAVLLVTPISVVTLEGGPFTSLGVVAKLDDDDIAVGDISSPPVELPVEPVMPDPTDWVVISEGGPFKSLGVPAKLEEKDATVVGITVLSVALPAESVTLGSTDWVVRSEGRLFASLEIPTRLETKDADVIVISVLSGELTAESVALVSTSWVVR